MAVRKSPLVVHGWSLYAHPLFLEQLERLATEVEALKRKDPVGYRRRGATKRLAAIAALAFDRIPRDPTLAEYRLGHALGPGHTHWFRAKFFQQYRIFFRFHASSRIIVFGWIAENGALATCDDGTDACRDLLAMRGGRLSNEGALLHRFGDRPTAHLRAQCRGTRGRGSSQ